MQLSRHTDFSLRVLIYLALQKETAPVTVQKIAEDYGISINHVAKVAQTLVRFEYVQSLRGRSGGLVLFWIVLDPAQNAQLNLYAS